MNLVSRLSLCCARRTLRGTRRVVDREDANRNAEIQSHSQLSKPLATLVVVFTATRHFRE
jgi:hypothetical protein